MIWFFLDEILSEEDGNFYLFDSFRQNKYLHYKYGVIIYPNLCNYIITNRDSLDWEEEVAIVGIVGQIQVVT